MRTALLLALIIVTSQTGCVVLSSPSYPKEWESVDSQTEVCAALPGNYVNSGKSGEQGKAAPTLTSLLFKVEKPATNVRIQKDGENSFLLTAEGSGAIIASRTVGVRCGTSQLTVRPGDPEGFINREGVVGYQYDSMAVYKAKDGALIVRPKTGGIGIILLIPFGGYETHWFQYPRAVPVRENEAP